MPAYCTTKCEFGVTCVTQGAPASNSLSNTSLREVKRVASAPPSAAMTATNFLSITLCGVGASGSDAGDETEGVNPAGAAILAEATASRTSFGISFGRRL